MRIVDCAWLPPPVRRSGVGRVPSKKVESLLSSGRFDVSPVEVQTLLSPFHVDEGGLVDYYEWLSAVVDWQQVQGSPSWQGWVREVFDQVDLNKSGFITSDGGFLELDLGFKEPGREVSLRTG